MEKRAEPQRLREVLHRVADRGGERSDSVVTSSGTVDSTVNVFGSTV